MLTQLQQHPKLAYWLIMGTVGLVSLLVILTFSRIDQDSINQRYNTPFRAKAEKAAAYRSEFKDTRFNQRGIGMSEANIQKKQGRRYETY